MGLGSAGLVAWVREWPFTDCCHPLSAAERLVYLGPTQREKPEEYLKLICIGNPPFCIFSHCGWPERLLSQSERAHWPKWRAAAASNLKKVGWLALTRPTAMSHSMGVAASVHFFY